MIMDNPSIPGLFSGSSHASLPPSGELLLITDHLDSPAEFILHRILAVHLKRTAKARAVLLSFSREFTHWGAIAAKSSTNLTQYLSSKSLEIIDGLNASAYDFQLFSNADTFGVVSCPPLLVQQDNLRALYFMVDRALHEDSQLPDNDDGAPAQRTVMIDDISMLELIGVPTADLIRFIRALRALCRSHSASLIIRAHALPSSYTSDTSVPFDSDLLRCLLDSCHVHVEVRPLTSGRSGTVSGEVAVHRGGLSSGDKFMSNNGRKTAVQYRLSDGGVVFFQRGMGTGIL